MPAPVAIHHVAQAYAKQKFRYEVNNKELKLCDVWVCERRPSDIWIPPLYRILAAISFRYFDGK